VAKLEKTAKPEKMTSEQIGRELERLPEWSESGEAIHRTYAFKDFLASIGFVNAIAQEAERVQHHPDVLIRYSKVTLTLSTHDADGVTSKDFALAATADTLAAGFAPPAPTKARK
jgi:4a-hydroxytetrahydrobiopterin dehydratase